MGYSAIEPANTVRSTVAAVAAGADMVEVDVSMTSDGHAVAIHGPRMEATTTGAGKVSELQLAEVQAVEVTHRGSIVEDCNVPELGEIVRAAGTVAFNFDLKTRAAIDPVLDLIATNELADCCVISGATASRVGQIRRRGTGVTVLVNLNRFDKAVATTRMGTRWLSWRYRRLLRRPDVLALNIQHRFVGPALVSAIHRIGAQVWTFTVDRQQDVDRVVAAGVDSITTNRPGELELPRAPARQ